MLKRELGEAIPVAVEKNFCGLVLNFVLHFLATVDPVTEIEPFQTTLSGVSD